VQLLAGETLDIRVLVDRPIVEIYVQQGRAAFVVSQPPNASSPPQIAAVALYVDSV